MSIPNGLYIPMLLLEVVLLFNLMIVVHELGHMLAAKWRGLKVTAFGIWFGTPIWKKTIGGVEYSLGWIPAGGFVRLPQMANGEIEGKETEEKETYPPAPPFDRAIVAAAGPLASFLLALFFATIVMAIGKPANEFAFTTVIGEVGKGGPGEKAGLKPGDRVLEVDGKKVTCFFGNVDSISWNVIASEADIIPFKIERAGQIIDIPVSWAKEGTAAWQRRPLRKVNIGPRITPIVCGAAEGGGNLKLGDFVEKINGVPISSLTELINFLGEEENPDMKKTLALQVVNKGERREVVTTVDEVLNVQWGLTKTLHPSPLAQVKESLQTMVNTFAALTSPKSDVGIQHLSGPVGIMHLYYRLFESNEGWRLAIAFSVLFNINLAMMNLIPMPVLDGGHIVLATIEGVSRRKIPTIAILHMQRICTFALLGFMLFVTFFDVSDFIPGKK